MDIWFRVSEMIIARGSHLYSAIMNSCNVEFSKFPTSLELTSLNGNVHQI